MIDIDISTTEFKELSNGDIFLYKDKMYLVIPYIRTEYDEYNCLELPRCSLNYVNDKSNVMPLEGHFQCFLKPGGIISTSICKSWEPPISGYGEGRCMGTKEMEYCSCDGDVRKCDFYPQKRI